MTSAVEMTSCIARKASHARVAPLYFIFVRERNPVMFVARFR
jgi:hypothetical protein